MLFSIEYYIKSPVPILTHCFPSAPSVFTGFIYPATVHNNPEKGKLTAAAAEIIIILLLFPTQHMQKRQTNRWVHNSRPPVYITNQPPSKSTTSTHLFISLRTFEVNERVHARQFSKATNFFELLCLVNILHLQIHQVTTASSRRRIEWNLCEKFTHIKVCNTTTTTREYISRWIVKPWEYNTSSDYIGLHTANWIPAALHLDTNHHDHRTTWIKCYISSEINVQWKLSEQRAINCVFTGNPFQKLEFSVVVGGLRGRRSETEPDRLCLVDWLQCVEKESAQ